MMFLIMAFATAMVGATPFLIAKYFKTFWIFAGIYLLISWLVFYFGLPSLGYGLAGWLTGITIIFTVISFVVLLIIGINNNQDEFSKFSITPSAVGILIFLVVFISGCGACNTGKYSALAGDMTTTGKTHKHWTQDVQELSPSHMRIVPEEHAIAIAKTALNQHSDEAGNIVGSQFPLSDDYSTLQKINNSQYNGLYYVIPLDFKSWGVWRRSDGVPGYVIVNAEDQHAKPEYIDGFKMKYTPEACFGQNLKRYLYKNGYYKKILLDYSFELDDNMKPYWVVSVCHRTLGIAGGIVVDGVVVVDPQTGETIFYKKNEAPAWVDRIIPAEVINKNLDYWGKYQNGWWNTTIFGRSVNLREPEETLLNYGTDGTCWYVTPMKPKSGNKDHSMTDLVYTNSRTGESHRYSVSGTTEEKILATVNATVKYQNLHGSGVVYENVANRLTALVPILAEDHSIRGLAFVNVETKNVVWDVEPMTALMRYQTSLSGGGSALGTDISVSEADYNGKITRIKQAYTPSGNIYYIYFDGKTQVYVVPQIFSEVVIAEPGDSVHIRYLNTESEFVSVNAFDNLTVDIKKSKNQQDAIQRVEQRKAKENKDDNRDSFKDKLRNGEISDKELDSLLNKTKKN